MEKKVNCAYPLGLGNLPFCFTLLIIPMKLQTLPLLLLFFLFTDQVSAQTITKKISFSTSDFSGDLEFEYSLGYNFEPYFKTRLKSVIIRNYKRPVNDYTLLNHNGIRFPYKVEKDVSVDVQARGLIYPVNGAYPKSSEKFIFNLSGSSTSLPEFPPFTAEDLNWLKSQKVDASLIGKEISGGEKYWQERGKIDEFSVVSISFGGLEAVIEAYAQAPKKTAGQSANKTTTNKEDNTKPVTAKKEETTATAGGGTGMTFVEQFNRNPEAAIAMKMAEQKRREEAAVERERYELTNLRQYYHNPLNPYDPVASRIKTLQARETSRQLASMQANFEESARRRDEVRKQNLERMRREDEERFRRKEENRRRAEAARQAAQQRAIKAEDDAVNAILQRQIAFRKANGWTYDEEALERSIRIERSDRREIDAAGKRFATVLNNWYAQQEQQKKSGSSKARKAAIAEITKKIPDPAFKEGLAAFRFLDAWGFLDKSGKEVIKAVYDEVRPIKEGVSIVQKDGKSGLIARTGKVLIPLDYQDIIQLSPDWFAVKKDGVYTIVNRQHKQVLNQQYEELHASYDGQIIFKQNNKYGLMNAAGKTIIPAAYNQLGFYFNSGRRLALRDSLYGFLDAEGKVAIPFIYTDAGDFGEGISLAPVKDKETGLWGYIDTDGGVGFPFKYKDATPFSPTNFASVKLNQEYSGYSALDYFGTQLFRREGEFPVWFPKDRIAIIDRNFYTTTGKEVIKRENLYARFPFIFGQGVVEYGSTGGNNGMIDRNGVLVVPPIFDIIMPHEDELWIARFGGSKKHLYINRKGEIVY